MVRWRVRVDAGIDPITGMRRQPMRSFPTKREAATGLARWITEIERGTAVDPSKQTLGEYLQHWLATSVQPRVRPATHSGYERLIRVQIIPRLGNIPLQKLTALQIQQCYTDMRTSPRVDGRDGTLSPRSVCYAHTVLKQALKQAARWRLISHNMAADVDPPKEVRPHVQVWNVAEAQWFLAAFQGDAYSPLWRVALSTGSASGSYAGCAGVMWTFRAV
jgi:hypothetical protein